MTFTVLTSCKAIAYIEVSGSDWPSSYCPFVLPPSHIFLLQFLLRSLLRDRKELDIRIMQPRLLCIIMEGQFIDGIDGIDRDTRAFKLSLVVLAVQDLRSSGCQSSSCRNVSSLFNHPRISLLRETSPSPSAQDTQARPLLARQRIARHSRQC